MVTLRWLPSKVDKAWENATRSRPVLPEVASVALYEDVTWSNTNTALENSVTDLMHFLNAFIVCSIKVYDFANAGQVFPIPPMVHLGALG